MSSVDKLNVRIAMDVSELKRGVASAEKSLRQLTQSTQSMSGSMKNSLSKVGNDISRSFSGIRDSVKRVGAAIASVAAAGQLTRLGKQAVDAASDLAEVQNVVDTVFGDMSVTINNWSKNAMNAFGLSETSAKRFTSTMGAMFKSSGITGNALQTMSVNMAALSADIASFYNISADRAFDKIRAGISGETEPLKQLGINMSVANMEAYALSQGITKSYSAMSQAEQTILRYNYLLSVTGDAQHDFERTSGSWANQTRVLAENFNRLKTIIGQGLIAALTPLVQLLNTLIQKVIEFANAIRAAFGQQDTNGLQNTASSAADTASGLQDANAAAQKLQNTIGGFDQLNIISDDSTTDMSGGISGLQPDSVYDTAAQSADEISRKMLDLAERLKEELQPISDLAEQIKQSFIDAFSGDNATRLTEELTRGFSSALDLIGAIADALSSAWELDGGAFAQSISDALYSVMELVNTISEALAAAFKSDAGTKYFAAILQLAAAVNDVISGAASALSEAFSRDNAGVQFFESVLSAAGSLYTVFAVIGETIANMWNSEVGVNFFSSLISLGNTFSGIVSMIADTFVQVWNTAGLGQSIIDGIVQIVTNLISSAAAVGERFKEAWNNAGAGEAVMSAILGAVRSIIQLVLRLSESWRNVWDSEATTAVFGGMLSTIQTVGETVKTVADNIRNAFSSTGADTQVFTAIQSAIQGIVSAAQSLASSLSSAFSGINWEPIVKAAGNLASAISDVVQAAAGLASGVLAEFSKQLAAAFSLSAASIINNVAKALSVVADALRGIDPNVIIRLAAAFVGLKAGLSMLNTISGVVSSVQSAIAPLLAVGKGATEAAKGLKGLSSSSSDTYTSMLKVSGIVAIISVSLAALAKAIADVIDAYAGLKTASTEAYTAMQQTNTITPGVHGGGGGSYDAYTASAASYRAVTAADIPQLASGGVVRSGNLFIAGERGPELVGSYGRQSAVVNNDQIVDAVSQGVAAAMQPLADSIAANDSKQTVRIRGTDLLYIMERAQRQRGNALSKNFAFGGV